MKLPIELLYKIEDYLDLDNACKLYKSFLGFVPKFIYKKIYEKVLLEISEYKKCKDCQNILSTYEYIIGECADCELLSNYYFNTDSDSE